MERASFLHGACACAGAGSVKQKYDKPLDYVHCIIGDLLWPICEHQ